MGFLAFLMYVFGLAISILIPVIIINIGWRIMRATERIANTLDKKENVQVIIDDVQKEGEGWKEEDGWEEEEEK